MNNLKMLRENMGYSLQRLELSSPVNFVCDESNNSPMTIEHETAITFQFENDNVNTIRIIKY